MELDIRVLLVTAEEVRGWTLYEALAAEAAKSPARTMDAVEGILKKGCLFGRKECRHKILVLLNK